ncbi:MAG: diaminopimelate epimerase [Sphingobacteriales bacterium]|jgi:diaminopimelate epimerase
MELHFYKYQGTGNDFILLDGREKMPELSEKQIAAMCNRRFGIGGDGLMILRHYPGYDFEMKYYNADGREGSMCGNGGRCIVSFAYHLGIHRDNYHFLAPDGEHEADIDINGMVRLKMNDVNAVKQHSGDFILNTGSPHYIKYVNDIREYDVPHEGYTIRNSAQFVREGINVNFVETVNDHTIFVRTFERGVEAETWSCGTGVTAAALVSAHNETGFNQVDVETLGGMLSVEYDRVSEGEYRNIWLIGPAEYVFEGHINLKKLIAIG